MKSVRNVMRDLGADEALHARLRHDGPPGPKLALEAGIAHEREWIAFWGRLA